MRNNSIFISIKSLWLLKRGIETLHPQKSFNIQQRITVIFILIQPQKYNLLYKQKLIRNRIEFNQKLYKGNLNCYFLFVAKDGKKGYFRIILKWNEEYCNSSGQLQKFQIIPVSVYIYFPIWNISFIKCLQLLTQLQKTLWETFDCFPPITFIKLRINL